MAAVNLRGDPRRRDRRLFAGRNPLLSA